VPYFICPNCRRRSIDHDRREDLTNEAVGCAHCGFGFLFELLDDYYPAPGTGFVGRDVTEALSIQTRNGDANPAEVAVEWGVRQLGKKISVKTRSGVTKEITADYFPAYDEDGGLLVALIPKT
jgi:hypothetical protein